MLHTRTSFLAMTRDLCGDALPVGSAQYYSGYGLGRIDFPVVKKVMMFSQNRLEKSWPVGKPAGKNHDTVKQPAEISYDPI